MGAKMSLHILFDQLENGTDYHFVPGPNYLGDMQAIRAVPLQYQSYPANDIQGRGILVNNNGLYGSFFRPTQPAQLVSNGAQINLDLLGGGIIAGQLYSQPLINAS